MRRSPTFSGAAFGAAVLLVIALCWLCYRSTGDGAPASRMLLGGTALNFGLLLGAFVALAREIRRRERAEAQARSAEIRLSAVLDETPSVVALEDLDGRYLFVNRQFERLFNTVRDDVIGKTGHQLFPPDAAGSLRAGSRLVLESGAPRSDERALPGSDGQRIYRSTQFPLRDAAGRIDAICSISTDVSDRRLCEEQLRAAAERLQLEVTTNQDRVPALSESP